MNTISQSEKFKDLYNVIQSNPVVAKGNFTEYLKKSKLFLSNGGEVVDGEIYYESDIGEVKGIFAVAEYLQVDLLAIKALNSGHVPGINHNNRYANLSLASHDEWGRFDYVHALTYLETHPLATFRELISFCNKTVEVAIN